METRMSIADGGRVQFVLPEKILEKLGSSAPKLSLDISGGQFKLIASANGVAGTVYGEGFRRYQFTRCKQLKGHIETTFGLSPSHGVSFKEDGTMVVPLPYEKHRHPIRKRAPRKAKVASSPIVPVKLPQQARPEPKTIDASRSEYGTGSVGINSIKSAIQLLNRAMDQHGRIMTITTKEDGHLVANFTIE